MDADLIELIAIFLAGGLAVGLIARHTFSRSFLRWFFYAALLLPIALVHLAILGLSDKTGSTFPKAVGVVALLTVGFLLYRAIADSTGFTDEDIVAAKDSIRAEFAKRDGVTVNEVELLREGTTKLTGYARLTIDGSEVVRACTAVMDDRAARFIWRCE